MFGETVEGWLSKTGLLGSTRHRRYCILSGNELRYFKQKTDTRPTGTIDLKHYSIAEKDSGKQHPYGFRLVSQCRHHRSYIFYADHEQGRQYWIDMINTTLDLFIGKHHTCHAPALSQPVPPLEEDNYSVLDKWLNRLDLNDQQHQTSPTGTGPSPSISSMASLSGTYHSSTTTKTMMTSTNTSNSTTMASSLSSYVSPSLRPYRTSTESLDSIPSETTLSSSAGSRAQLSNAIFTPTTINGKGSYHHHHHHHPSPHYHPVNSPPTQFQSPTSKTTTNRRLSNPVALLSNFKQHRSNQQLGDNNKNPPAWSLESMASSSSLTSSSTNNNIGGINKTVTPPRKDWESDELFDFEDEMLYSTHVSGVRPPPPMS